METPIGKQEFANFQTMQSAVFTRNHIILTPELRDKKGQIFSKYHVHDHKQWLMSLRVRIGNEIKTEKGGAGMGIYYLKTVKKSSLGDGLFGYSKIFDGLGIYLNSILSSPGETGGYENYI